MASIKSTSKARFSTTHERMIRAVVNFALSAENISTTQSVVAFYALILAVKDNLASIDQQRSLVARPITGYAAEVNALKAKLSQTSSNIMHAVNVYALEENNMALANSMLTSRSVLNRMKNVTLVQYVRSAINDIKPIIDKLHDFNVTAKTVSNWQALCSEFNNIISSPKNAIADRQTINKNIQCLLRECMIALYQECDPLSAQYMDNNIHYYNAYRANRKLNPNHMSTQLRVHVMNEKDTAVTTGEVFILGTDKSAALNEEGYALIASVPFGKQTISVTTPFGTLTFGPFNFKKGKSMTKHIQISTTTKINSSAGSGDDGQTVEESRPSASPIIKI